MDSPFHQDARLWLLAGIIRCVGGGGPLSPPKVLTEALKLYICKASKLQNW